MSIVETRYGEFNVIDTDGVISRSLLLYGEWAQHEINLLAHFIQPGSVVVDAGAFIGTHARAFSTLVGSLGKVYAFEPRQVIGTILLENAKLSPIDNICVINSALGSTEEFMTIPVQDIGTDGNYGACGLEQFENQDSFGEKVSIVTLDAYRFNRLHFLKIDVEGMELEVLNGAKKTLERCRPVIFAECNSLEASVPIIEWCKKEKYQVYGVLNSAYNQHNFAGSTDNIFGTSQETGVLLIPVGNYSQWKEVLFEQHLPQIKIVDDLALLLLHKPQYPYEVLAHASAVKSLSLEYTSPKADILKQSVSERDEQISELNQTVTERDEQISNLNHTLSDRDEQIKNLTDDVAVRDVELSGMYNSRSWRGTHPFRVIAFFIRHFQEKNIRRLHVFRRLPLLSRSLNPTRRFILHPIKQNTIKAIKFCYQRFPLFQSQKNHIKDFCYQRFPFLFSGVPSYEFWQASRGTVKRNSSNLISFLDETCDWDMMLPSKASEPLEKNIPPNEVDVIVPVYRGLDQTRRCINSVLNSVVKIPFRLIVINDASPEMRITEYLQNLSSSEQVIIAKNTKNLGFPATVNRGMGWSNHNDVVLLNSDTEVANDWLDKLKVQAYSGSTVGTVTPFSNNATICSYPTLEGMRNLPDGETVQSLDAAFSRANCTQNIEIPTAVGFCMYIRRDCLSEVGLFDVETFGKGYGEENDFCLRASAKGWKHLLASDTFVFHEGEVSFQEGSKSNKEAAMDIIRERYPDYETIVAKHVDMNPAYPLRVSATAARFKQSNLPVVLHILHAQGGGTEKHVEELCRTHFGKAKLLIMSPQLVQSEKPGLQIRSADPLDALDIYLPTSNVDFLVSLYLSFGVSLVHIHHVLGFSFDLKYLVKKLGAPFYLTVHDYMFICPRINLMPIGQDYCGEPDPSECNQCISVDFPQGASDIIWWREKHVWLFNEASEVICPTHDVVNRYHRYFPEASYRVVSHEKPLANNSASIKVPTIDGNEPLRIAILGVLTRHKGFDLIVNVLSVSSDISAPLQFKLIGFAEDNIPPIPTRLFSQTGSYDDSVLQKMIESFNPHLILFPARCPETYSYTLTAAIKSGRPIMVPDFGAFPERISARPWTWVFEWNITGSHLVDRLCETREKYFVTRTPPAPFKNNKGISPAVLDDNGFYGSGYFPIEKNTNEKNGIIDIRSHGKVTVLLLVETAGIQPSPCAYIRLILPLIRERGEKLDLRWVTGEEVPHYLADVLICQRTAVTSMVTIEKIVDHCHQNNIRIVYDLDDLLLALPDTHPEYVTYLPRSAAVFRFLVEADEVWVSTEALQHQVSQINLRTQVVPNYIDDQVWTIPKVKDDECSSKEIVRLLYMGTQTHLPDFELVKGVLKSLKKEFVDRIEISLIGISESVNSNKWYKTVMPPQAIDSGYPAFVNWICNGLSFDIGIAPLVDNEFNRSKSAIKFFEYSALGLAIVASDLNVYTCIRHGENGFLVENTEESWYLTLKELITDSDLRKRMQRTVQNEVFKKYGYESVSGYRTELLKVLLTEENEKTGKNSRVTSGKDGNNSKIKTMDVNRNLVASAFLTGVGIEIGALHNPLPVSSLAKVRYVDRMDKQGLYEQYPELRQYDLVDVDFIDNGESLQTFEDNIQDFIIANHFLEHCEDPIATLKTFFRVLRSGGTVFLALPDMRFTFDKNRQRTTLSHLVRDHQEGSATSRLEHFREWPKFVEPHFGRIYGTEEKIEQRALELMNQNYSIHYHAWEPQDVYEMLQYCSKELGIPLSVVSFISKKDEMLIILRKIV